MQGRITNLIKKMVTYLSIILLLLFGYSETYSSQSKKSSKKVTTLTKSKKSNKKNKNRKSRRSYNPSLTRTQALEILQTNSKDLCQLAGLEPRINQPDSSATSLLKDQSEEDLDQISTTSTDEPYQEGEDLEELEREDDVAVDIEQFRTLWLAYVDDEVSEQTDGGFQKKEIMDAILDWLGTPYYYGGLSSSGIDCSGFTRTIYEIAGSGLLPRSARTQYEVGKKVKRPDLQFGDLVFFNTRSRVYVSHVGIYLGDNLFAHSSSRYGVTISSLESTYYSNRFIGARRIYLQDLAQKTIHPYSIQSKLYSQKVGD